MRSSTEGCVANHPPSGNSAGLSMKKACIREGIEGIAACASIFRSAEIIASGFLVSSADPASARYSREREIAKRINTEAPKLNAMIARAITMASMAPPPPSRSSRELSRRGEKPKGKFQLRNIRSAAKAKTPAKMVATTINCVSRLRICVSSWPSTASTSASFR